jgi:hypothetical protein
MGFKGILFCGGIMQKRLTAEDFANLFGVMSNELGDSCRAFIDGKDFNYRALNKKEHDEIILDVLKRLDSGSLDASSAARQKKWEVGWKENLDAFIESGYAPSALLPKYVRADKPLRLYQEYVKPNSPSYEIDFFTVLRIWLFNQYLNNVNNVYEFGCGTGYNLVMLANIFPDKKFVGLDWATSAVDLVNLIGEKCCKNVHGRFFNMYFPDKELRLEKNSAVLTIGSLEQMGTDFKSLIDYLCKNKPKICINIEPLYDMYDGNSLLDYLAMKYHAQRNYLRGFLTYLNELADRHIIEITKVRRMYFGSLFHDGWSIFIWRPL